LTITQSTVFITALKSFMLLALGEGCESERDTEMRIGVEVRGMRESRESGGGERGKRGKREGDKIERGERGEGEMVEKRRGGEGE
jgi:hypothetical protein